MNGSNDSSYYRRRAEQSAALAGAATMPEVRRIHLELAERYTALAEPEPQRQRPRLKLAF